MFAALALSTASAVLSPIPVTAVVAPSPISMIGGGVDGPVRINEFMADNAETLADQDGDDSDWAELLNATAAPVDLLGWGLSDDPADPFKWTFPSVTLQPGEYLVVFASDKNLTNPSGELHTNFKLTADGEWFGLTHPSGVVSSEYAPQFPPQTTDVSYGFDGTGTSFFVDPTPGTTNAGTVDGFVQDTEFDVDRGFFTAPFAVAITSDTEGATIRYTTDGSAPTETTGTVYTGPLWITETTVLRAIATKPNWAPTNVDTQTYVFLDQVVQQPAIVPGYPNPVYDVGAGNDVATHDYEMDPAVVNDPAYQDVVVPALESIPTLSVAVDPGQIFFGGFYDATDVEVECSIEVLYADDPAASHQSSAGIESHSHKRLKRSLRLNFRAEYGDAKFETDLFEKAPLNGDTALDEFDTLILRAGNNRSWARNWNPDKTTYVIDQFYRDSQIAMSGHGSRGTFVHLYINGLYWGLYNIVERSDEKFTSAYFDGAKEDWFAVSHGGVISGDAARWDYLKGQLTNKNMANAANYAELLEYLEPSDFSDYLILNWWTATGDWPTNNWYGGNRNPTSPLGATPHQFFAWDGEWSWDAPNGFANPSGQAHVHPDFESHKSGGPTIAKIWHAARANEEFMLLFADRVHEHTGPGGALDETVAKARLKVLTDFVYDAVVAESARWGDALSELFYPLRTRDVDWQNEVDALNQLMTGNGDVFIAALRAEGYYPSIDPPLYNHAGGAWFQGFELAMSDSSGTGTIHYTTNGTDPRLVGGAVSPAASTYTAPVQLLPGTSDVWSRTLSPTGEWSALTKGTFEFTPNPAIPYGCGFNPAGSLTLQAGEPAPGGTLFFGVDNPLGTQSPGSIALLSMALAPDAGFPCGIPVPGLGMSGPGAFGEILISLLAYESYFSGDAWTGAGNPAPVYVGLPDSPVLSGLTLFFQGLIIDPTAVPGVGVPFGLTSALALGIE